MNSVAVVLWSTSEQGLVRGGEAVAMAGAKFARDAEMPAIGIVLGTGTNRAAESLAASLPTVLGLESESGVGFDVVRSVVPELVQVLSVASAGLVLLPANPDGRDIAGWLAGTLGWGVISNAREMRWSADHVEIETEIFGGNWVVTSAFAGQPGIVTVGPDVATSDTDPVGGTIAIRRVRGGRSPVVSEGIAMAATSEPAIDDARIVVAGGRGVGTESGFALVRELAQALGGAVGASLAAVDEGWVPYRHQVGQTGKIIRPDLYVAVGISGAIGHTVGMQGARTVISVNSDPDAPIRQFSDLFVQGDLLAILPALIDLLGRADPGEPAKPFESPA